jgi:L-malate glycosyltransferase
MHVLFLSTGYPNYYYPLDGIFYRDQAEAVASTGIQTGFIAINPVSVKHVFRKRTLKHISTRHFELNGVATVVDSYINIPRRPLYAIRQSLKRGARLLENYIGEKGKPDIIHLQCFDAVELAVYAKNKFGIPYIITEHSSRFLNGTLSPLLEEYAAKAFNESKINIAVSEGFAKVLSEKYKRPFQFVPNVVNTDYFTPGNQKPAKPFVFLNVAALDQNKNQTLIIDAFEKIASKYEDAKVIIVGEGPEKLKLMEAVRLKGLQGRIFFEGAVGREHVRKFMQQAHAFILSSKFETFGVVLLEAMSSGLPLISTRSLGPSSVITSDRLGILCDHTPESMAASMEKILLSYNQYNLGEIRQYALDHFANFAVGQKLASLYKTVIND